VGSDPLRAAHALVHETRVQALRTDDTETARKPRTVRRGVIEAETLGRAE